MREIFRNWKVLLLVFLIVVSAILVSPDLFAKGIVVTSKARDSPVPLAVGDALLEINGKQADLSDLQKNYTGVVKLKTAGGEKFVKLNGTLGIEGKKAPSSRLSFGLDIEGGVRAIIRPEKDQPEYLQQIQDTLQTRINIYGLKESALRMLQSDGQGFIEITMAGGTTKELKELLERQGEFEAKINFLVDNNKKIEFEKEYTVTVLDNNSVEIADQDKKIVLSTNQTKTIDKIPVTLMSVQNNKANLSADVFTGEDIIFVYVDPQRSGLERTEFGYNWFFQVKLSQEGAKKFAHVTKNLNIVPARGSEGYLSSPINLYLDNELIDSLNIAASLRGQEVQEPSITGQAPDAQTALQTRRTLQTILRSGSLPTKIEIMQLEVISPKLGEAFLRNIMLAIVSAVVAVSVIVAVRYRKKSIVIPMIATSMSEIIIIFGASVVIGWTIDIASVAAIIALIGTGIDAQIILIDHTIREDAKTIVLKERIKRALFIIIGAGGTVIGAMIPLTVLGLGVLRGFALTTIIGVIIGIFITRPAFGEIIKKFS